MTRLKASKSSRAAAILAAISVAVPILASPSISNAQEHISPPLPTECGLANRYYWQLPEQFATLPSWNIQRDVSNNPDPATNPYASTLFDYSEFDLANDAGKILINASEVPEPTLYENLDMQNMSPANQNSGADDMAMTIARISGTPGTPVDLTLTEPSGFAEAHAYWIQDSSGNVMSGADGSRSAGWFDTTSPVTIPLATSGFDYPADGIIYAYILMLDPEVAHANIWVGANFACPIGLALEKVGTHDDANNNGLGDVGETIDYTFTITNTGTSTLNNVTLTDATVTVSGSPIASLAPGETDSSTYTASYTITQADLDAGGRIENQATVTGTDRRNNTAEDLSDDPNDPTDNDANGNGNPDDPTVIVLPIDPALDLTKTSTLNDANGNGLPDAGETISYSFTVENTGNVTVTDIVLSDDSVAVSGGPIASLAPGASDATTFTGSYTITQADIDAGSFSNVATATGQDPNGEDVTALSHDEGGTPGEPTVTELPQNPSMTLIKIGVLNDANGNMLGEAGETITYSFTVENTGNVTLENITLSDPKVTVSGTLASLAPGATDTGTFTGTYTLTVEDVNAGGVSNVATANGQTPGGTPVSAQSSDGIGAPGTPTQVPLEQSPELDFVKTAELEDANNTGFANAGETITYSFTVMNTGNVTVSDIVVSDSLVDVTGGPITLEPGESDATSFTASYTLTQADIDAGTIANVATATGKDPNGEDVTRQSRDEDGVSGEETVFALSPNPQVELKMIDTLQDANGNGFPDAGETVRYEMVVVNTGNVTLSDLTIADLQVDFVDVVSQAAVQPLASVPVDGSLASLGPQQTDRTAFSADYVLTQEDVDAGRIDAQTEVTGTAPDGALASDISDDPDDATDKDVEGDNEPDDPNVLLLEQNPAMETEKVGVLDDQGGDGFPDPGDRLAYTVTVANTGNVTLEDVAAQDEGPSFDGEPGTGNFSAFDPASADLAPGESQDFVAYYTLTAADLERIVGVRDAVQNAASATGTPPSGEPFEGPEATATVDLPVFIISKVAGISQVRRGSRVPYTIGLEAQNVPEGVPVTITDTMPPGFSYVPGTGFANGMQIEPEREGRQLTFTDLELDEEGKVELNLMLAVTAAVEPGEYINRAIATGPGGRAITDEATAVVEVVVEPLFDCGDLIGKVFDDENRNGYQDPGEGGIAGARVASVKGLLVTADAHGRFHVACADLPDRRIGTNYIMKLDPRSLPSGYRITTENPRVIRLTAGKASELSFGASLGRVIRLDLSDAAFAPGSRALLPEWSGRIDQLVTLLEAEPTVLRLAYSAPGGGRHLARQRLGTLRHMIAERWKTHSNRYRLEIETRIETQRPERKTGRRTSYK